MPAPGFGPSKNTNGSTDTYEKGRFAGENHEDSATLGYQAVRGKRNLTLIGTTSAHDIGGSTAADEIMLHGFRVLVNFTGNLVIDGFEDEAGAAQSITFTTPTAGWYEMGDVIASAGKLTVTASNVADDLDCFIVWSTN